LCALMLEAEAVGASMKGKRDFGVRATSDG